MRNVCIWVGVSVVGFLWTAENAIAAVSATVVPGSLVQGTVKASLGTGTSYAVETNNLGDWPLKTGGTTTVFPMALTNGNFNGAAGGNSIIAFGNGGGVTLQLTSPVHPVAGAKEIGIFTAQFLVASTGALFNGNMEAAVLVSDDDVNWFSLAGDAVASPTSYTAGSVKLNVPTLAYDYGTTAKAWSFGSGTAAANLAASAVADFTMPMPDDHLFNGSGTNADRLAIKTDSIAADYDAMFGTSGGGNWIDVSGSGLSEIRYLRLNGVNVDATGGVRLDAVFASAAATAPEPGTLAVLGVGVGVMLGRRRGLNYKL